MMPDQDHEVLRPLSPMSGGGGPSTPKIALIVGIGSMTPLVYQL